MNAAVTAGQAAQKKAEELSKTLSDDEKSAIINAAFSAIDWDVIIEDLEADLIAVAQAAVGEGIMQLQITAAAVISEANNVAADYARNRAAEMVGRRWNNGRLVDNPDARWTISETTREDIRDSIEAAFRRQTSITSLAEALQTSGTFSNFRATLIAKTEVAMAQIRSNLDIWRRTGMVKSVNILTSLNHVGPDECDLVVAGNPYLIDQVPQMPVHPLCMCRIVAAEITQ